MWGYVVCGSVLLVLVWLWLGGMGERWKNCTAQMHIHALIKYALIIMNVYEVHVEVTYYTHTHEHTNTDIH